MEENRWKSVWEKKGLKQIDLNRSEFDVFCDLKRSDGFDVSVQNEKAYFSAFYQEWQDMYENVGKIARGEAIQSVYEVGCGSGVNLYLFQNRIKNVILGGIDYSQGMIDTASLIIDSTDLTCGEAANILEQPKYDLVMSDSVFQYFKDLDYAEKVLEKMIHKSNKITYLSEIHDMDQKEDWLANRRKLMENYDIIYDGLGKTFYSKDWITNIAKRNHKKVLFMHSDNAEYWNSKYVFHCFIYS